MDNHGENSMTEADENVQIWRFKRIIKTLENCRGNGTSMISLIIPPKKQISEFSQFLENEKGTASNIKSRVNRLSVLAAITSAQQKLKLYNKVPPNGLILYCGIALTEEGKEKKLNIAIEPFKPVTSRFYHCDSKFHTEALSELLTSDAKFGFIVMDGNGTLFGTLAGNNREIIHRFTVELPKKHGRGGQSALRFSRLRDEKRHNYVRKVAEQAVQLFIVSDKVLVAGIILAGSADFKTELRNSEILDKRLKEVILKEVDVSYGGERGFNQAIELSSEHLQNVKYIKERKLICKFFDEISLDSFKYCYGIGDTLRALELGAVETLIIWENLDTIRYELRSPASESSIIKYLSPAEETERSHFVDDLVELEVIEKMSLLEWFAEHYKDFGTTLEIITNKSQEGCQFVRGFGGIGGLLRYKIDVGTMAQEDEEFISDEDYF